MTSRCETCRYWSARVARAYSDGRVEAMCLSGDGPLSGTYTSELASCQAWKSGHHGAVDAAPNSADYARSAYAKEDVA